MDEKMLAELLDAYTEKLLREGDEKAEEVFEVFPQYKEVLAPLAKLVKELRGALAPVSPSPAFRRELLAQLKSYTPTPRKELFRGWVIQHRRELAMGAALVGFAFSLAGVVAYFVKMHGHRQARKAAA